MSQGLGLADWIWISPHLHLTGSSFTVRGCLLETRGEESSDSEASDSSAWDARTV